MHEELKSRRGGANSPLLSVLRLLAKPVKALQRMPLSSLADALWFKRPVLLLVEQMMGHLWCHIFCSNF